MNMGNVIDMGWDNMADAILHAWMPGQEGGNAIADVLSGHTNPSGRLPMTIARKYEDYSSSDNFPKSNGIDGTVNYDEDIFVGYRGFDRDSIQPAYPFGFGLSYTTFGYSDISAIRDNDDVVITATVTNTGNRPGKEVVLVFASAPESDTVLPKRELRGFAKTSTLKRKMSDDIEVRIPVESLRYYDEFDGKWVLPKGEWRFMIGDESVTLNIEGHEK